MQRDISLMFIEGMAGRNFSRPLSFFLDRSEEYLRAIENITNGFNCKTEVGSRTIRVGG